MAATVSGPLVGVLDYGSGNLRSAERALIRAGARVLVTPEPDVATRADGLVVPGVGAFAACMAAIDAIGAREAIRARVGAGGPTLGICVGMQIMFQTGEEHGATVGGIGLLPGAVRRLDAARVPHMGWNTLSPAIGSRLFDGLASDARFYFVHSYAARPTATDGVATHTPATRPTATDAAAGRAYPRQAARGAAAPSPPLISTADHGGEFIAAIEQGALAATQFHPEKSGDAGATLLRNWVRAL